MPTPLSPNMKLPIPIPTVTEGAQYAYDEQSCFNKMDTHNHTNQNGVQIPTDGLNINAALTMNNNALINVKQVGLTDQASVLDAGSIYRKINDLYYRDGAGAEVRITQGGSVAVSGAIGFTGLPSGTASASYNSISQTFIFESATNTPANIDGASIVVRPLAASPKGITLSAPALLAADYSIELPGALPALSTLPLLLNPAGALTVGGTATEYTATTVNALSKVAIKNDTGVLEFRDSADAVQFATVTATSTGVTQNLPDAADSYLFKINNVTKASITNSGIDGQYIYNYTPAANVLATSGAVSGSIAPVGTSQLMTSFNVTTTKNNAVIMGDFLTGSFSIFSGTLTAIDIVVLNPTRTQILTRLPISGNGFNVNVAQNVYSYSGLIQTAGTYTVRLILYFSYGGGGGTVDWTNVVARIIQVN